MGLGVEHLMDYRPAADLLTGRVILVTGAGDGLGRAASLSFAGHGATVILLGRTVAKLNRVYDAIVDADGPQPAIYPMDLAGATVDDYEELAQVIDREFGRLDGLLHNAAVLGTLTPLGLYDTKVWHQVLRVNLNAPFLLTRACEALLKRAPDASLLFTSCAVGRKGRAYWGAYGVSKFAVEGLMQIWADELETAGVRCNSIDPGPVRTGLRARAYPGEDPGRLKTPEAAMSAYLYLMGPDSRGVSGEAFNAQ
jgi:NAD(P)-dependent dehydrogenase (short-subunit alcohol dehydrogenase family)